MKKMLFVLAILTGSVALINAQSAQWQWVQHAGDSYYELANAITYSNNGHLIVTGTFSSSSITIGSTPLTNASLNNYSDFFIAEYDTAGNVIWARAFGGMLADDAYDVTTDPSGNIYVTGSFTSWPLIVGTDTLYCTDASGDSADVFIAAFDASGNPLWAKSATGMGHEDAHSIAADTGGNIYITGEFDSDTVRFGGQFLVNAAPGNSYDAFLVKYNSAGNVQWATSIGGTDYEFSKGVTVLPGDNIVIAGYSNSDSIVLSTGTVHNNSNPGYSDLLTACYTSSGALIWARMAGGSSDEMASDVTTDGNGNVIVCGSAWSSFFPFGSDSFTIYSAFGTDIILLKYDGNGNPQWITGAGGQNDDAATAVYCDAQNNIFLGGSYCSPTCHFGNLTLTNGAPGFGDVFVAQYDQGGTEIAVLRAGGNQSDGLLGLTVDNAGGLYAVGAYYSNPCQFGSTTINCSGWYDLFVAKWSVLWTGIEEQSGEPRVVVYPDPFSEHLTIAAAGELESAELYAADGRLVACFPLAEEVQSIAVGDLPEGNYILRIVSDRGVTLIRLVKAE